MNDNLTQTFQLVRRAQEGDQESREDLFRRYLPIVRHMVAQQLGRRVSEMGAELDDIVLPIPTFLEENSFHGGHADAVSGEDVGHHQVQQRVVEPPEGVRDPIEVMMDIYE